MKLGGATPEPSAPAEPAPSDGGFDDLPSDDMGGEPSSEEKPFDDEPFDAGVEADEESEPKKYIEQLTGKLGQSLRKYNEAQGQPDFELEKFAINSLLSATHTSEMDAEDQKDIINKVKSSGQGDEDVAPESDTDMPSDEDMPMDEPSDEEDLEEYRVFENMDNLFVNPKKNNMFQPGSNDKLNESCWDGYKQVGMKEKDGKQVPNCVPTNENLQKSEKSSIFNKIKSKLKETFNQDDTMSQPMTEPAPVITPTKPAEKPSIQPSRKNKPFLPIPNVQPDPKAKF